MLALIDGDVICYACGFSVEETNYVVTAEENETFFRYKKEADEFVKTLDCTFSIDKVVNIPPVSHAFQAVKEKILYVLDTIKASEVTIYLTGKDNFRDTCSPLLAPYKGHRDKDVKPYYYHEIREYLVNTWKAVVVDGIEADDAMARDQIANMEKGVSTCICTIDKDLNQIPGLHFNWMKEELFNVSPQDAIRYYYYQMLRGDPTDNITGIPGIGDKKAKSLVDSCAFEDLPSMLLSQYEKAFGENGEIFLEQTDKLIKIRMDPDDFT